MNKKDGLDELALACEEVIRVAEEHSYLWEDPSLWKRYKDIRDFGLTLFWGFIAQDESYSITLIKKGDKFEFSGKEFYAKNNDSRSIARAMSEHHISAEELRKSFYESLKEPLGKYLANQYLKKDGRK